MSRLTLPLALLVASVAGCTGIVRATGGQSYATNGNARRSGPSVGADSIFTLKPGSAFYPGKNPPPVALQTGVFAFFSDDLTSVGWPTALGIYSPPRPVSGYLLGGTNLHFDKLNGRFEFGNFNPFAEIGLIGAVATTAEGRSLGPAVTLALDWQMLVHNIGLVNGDTETVDYLLGLKFGFAYEIQ